MTTDTKRRFLALRIPLVVLVVVSLSAWISLPNFVQGGPGRLTGVIKTVRQIDATKQQLAYERGITSTAQCTNDLIETDSSPCLEGSKERIDQRGFGFDRRGQPHSGFCQKHVISALDLHL
jgi:hypothetical protein